MRIEKIGTLISLCAVSLTGTLAYGQSQTFYRYDALGRLVNVDTRDASGSQTTYSYDRADNRTSVSSEKTAKRNRLTDGELLDAGKSILSASGRTRLSLYTDGNLVLAGYEGQIIWQSNTAGSGGRYLAQQSDGHLVLYTADWRPVWSTGIYNYANSAGSFALVQDDGNFVVYSSNEVPQWATNTVY